MSAAAALRLLETASDAETLVGEQIEDFLSGRTNGAGLFHALYDSVMDEEIPATMLALLRG
jgi:hypothetical protein